MNVLQVSNFTRIIKKLSTNQRIELDEAVGVVATNLLIGVCKKGDLLKMRVYKFRMLNQLMLLAYKFFPKKKCIELWFVGTHENFYRDLKNNLKS